MDDTGTGTLSTNASPHAASKLAASYNKIVLLQLLLTLCLAITLVLFSGGTAAVSALIGGGIATAGSALYARLARVASDSAAVLLRAHFRAEIAKITAVAVLFALVLMYMRWVALPWMFIAFIVASLGYWFSLKLVK